MSLFGRLLSLHKNQSGTGETPGKFPEEDFFTEVIGHLGETRPDILMEWLNREAFRDSRDFDSLRVRTQVRFDPPPGYGIESRVDVVIEVNRPSGSTDLIFLESKIRSKEGWEQLLRYRATLSTQAVPGERWLLYVTRDYEAMQQDHAQNEQNIRFKQLRWFQFYRVLRELPPDPLVTEIVSFMEESGMSRGNKFTAKDALTIQNLASASSLMKAALSDDVERKFTEITGAVEAPKHVFHQLVRHGRFIHICYFKAQWWCGLGFVPSEDDSDFPLVEAVLEIDPASKSRNIIVSAMKAEISRESSPWVPYNLDQPHLWCGLTQRKNLSTFLSGDDHVAAIQAFFLKTLRDVEEFKQRHPDLPWGK